MRLVVERSQAAQAEAREAFQLCKTRCARVCSIIERWKQAKLAAYREKIGTVSVSHAFLIEALSH
jgi:hypothetical protein